MVRLPRVLLLALLVLCTCVARAQTSTTNGFCDVGAVPALTSGLKSTNTLLGVIPYCTVTVYLHGTQTLATLYSNSSNTPLANPFTATNTGFWQFYAATGQAYDVMGSGGVAPNTYPSPTLIPGGGGGSGGTASPPSYSVQFAAYPNSNNFASDGCISINPVSHTLIVCGGGTGSIALAGGTSGSAVTQTVNASTGPWNYTWPTGPPGTTTQCNFGTPTGVGSWRYCVAGVDVTQFAGSDIGAQTNAAISGCIASGGSACQLYVPAGGYTFTTPIVFPMYFFNHLSLKLDNGASLTYSGTGCAITASVNSSTPTTVNLRISGGQLYAGSNSPMCGVHVLPSNGVWITDMLVYGFAAGQGVWLDGVNGASVKNNIIDNNQVGVFATNTLCSGNSCSPTGSGTVYTPNAIHIKDNVITGNANFGVQFYDEFTGGSEGAENDSIQDNDLEENGSAGAGFGAISVGMSRGMVVSGNYFEGSPLPMQFGIPGGNDGSNRFFASVGLTIKENHFTLGGAAGPAGISINLLDTDYTIIEGNEVLGASENSSSCFINTLARTGGNIGETHTYLGTNAWYPDENTSAGNYTCVGGSPANLFGAGSYATVNTNYVPQVVNLNYVITSAGTSETVAVSGNVVSGSPCYVVPFNATAVTNSPNINPSFFIATGTNTGTLYHPANTNGLRVTIICVPGPFN